MDIYVIMIWPQHRGLGGKDCGAHLWCVVVWWRLHEKNHLGSSDHQVLLSFTHNNIPLLPPTTLTDFYLRLMNTYLTPPVRHQKTIQNNTKLELHISTNHILD